MSTYTGNNQQLQYNAETGTWSLVNIAQNFVDTSTFSTLDPKFEYINTDDSDDDTTVDPCPLGYILQDGTCVVDPDYVPPTQASSGGGGGQPTPTPKQQSDYDLGREALESFSALKDKIDFGSYDPKTKTVKLKDPENKNMADSLITLFSPGAVIAGALFDFKDKADLSAVEYGGVKAYSEDEKGEGSINLEVLYNNLQTTVLNPNVPEGNLLAGTPSYNGTDDTNGFYKTFFTSWELPKEQRSFFGAPNINDIFEATLKARKASDDLLTQPTADLILQNTKDSSSDSALPNQDILDDIDNAIEDSEGDSGSDSGPGSPGYVAPSTGSTGAPGRNYATGKGSAEDNRKSRQEQNQQFSEASQKAAAARAASQKQKQNRGSMGSGRAFGGGSRKGTGGGAPGYN